MVCSSFACLNKDLMGMCFSNNQVLCSRRGVPSVVMYKKTTMYLSQLTRRGTLGNVTFFFFSPSRSVLVYYMTVSTSAVRSVVELCVLMWCGLEKVMISVCCMQLMMP